MENEVYNSTGLYYKALYEDCNDKRNVSCLIKLSFSLKISTATREIETTAATAVMFHRTQVL